MPAFSARLSRLRLTGAAICLGLVLVPFVTLLRLLDVTDLVTLCCLGALFVALVARRSWARPILLGGFAAVGAGALASALIDGTIHPIVLADIGVVVFLAPSRHRALSRPGIALALQAWTFIVAVRASALNPGAVATLGVQLVSILAIAGIVRGARWSLLFSFASAVGLGVLLLATFDAQYCVSPAHALQIRAFLASGIVTALAVVRG